MPPNPYAVTPANYQAKKPKTPPLWLLGLAICLLFCMASLLKSQIEDMAAQQIAQIDAEAEEAQFQAAVNDAMTEAIRDLIVEAFDIVPVNETCPQSGKPISMDSLTKYRDKVVGFCNVQCRDDFVANVEERSEDRAAFDVIIDAEVVTEAESPPTN